MRSLFHFKQFSVDQSNCTMKINTDGVLLAALHAKLGRRILDVGTGTGVIAMMLAQKYPQAKLIGLEIDEGAALQAAQNFENSKFAERLEAVHSDIKNYEPDEVFDVIVSNPPFFLNALQNPHPSKSLARHTDGSFFQNLLAFSNQYLSRKGSLHCILPIDTADKLVCQAESFDLHLQKEINISSFQDSPVIRKIVQLGKATEPNVEKETFYIYEEQKVYSRRYKELLRPYFLNY